LELVPTPLEEPEVKVGSPAKVATTGFHTVVRIGDELGERVGDELGERDGDELGERVGDELGERVGAAVGGRLGVRVGVKVGESEFRGKDIRRIMEFERSVTKANKPSGEMLTPSGV
jgi:hypothetical protein